jgi:hypothetical protein
MAFVRRQILVDKFCQPLIGIKGHGEMLKSLRNPFILLGFEKGDLGVIPSVHFSTLTSVSTK